MNVSLQEILDKAIHGYKVKLSKVLVQCLTKQS